jgi:DNA gyrase subunit B
LIKILIKFLVDSTVWVSVVNALSNHLRLLFIVVMVKCINKNTKRKTLYPVKQIGETKKRNNSYFYPDETIFTQTTDFSYDTLSARMRELSYLNKGIQ